MAPTRGKLVLLGALALLVVWLASGEALAQSSLEGLAAQRISQETGIPREFVRALFVDEPDAQFILAFIYINEQTVNGRLRPEIKDAITPYVHRNALLVLVVPAKRSAFDPRAIFFVQNVFRIDLQPQMIVPITPDFQTGTLEEGQVSAGILTLDTTVLVSQPFEIHYGGYSTTFVLGQAEPDVTDLGLGGVFRFFLLNLLLLFLFPFLLAV